MKTMPALLVLAFSVTVSASFAQMSPPATPSHARTSCSRLPIYFIENRGRFPDHVALYVQGNDKMIFFARDGITIQLKGPKLSWAVKLVFVDANPDAVLQGEDRQQAVFSYFSGKEEDWKAGLKTYSRVVYHDLWPGIDLVYQGTVNHLKYEFRVQPGADPNRIRLRYEGASRVTTTDAGALRVETPAGSIQDAPPIAWQDDDAVRSPVSIAYVLRADGSYGFHLGPYDASKLLILDPVILVYCGYVGGSSTDEGYGIAVDSAGNPVVTGTAQSDEQTFPVVRGPDTSFNSSSSSGGDAFVLKLSQVDLMAAGAPRIGETITLSLLSTDDSGLSYHAATSFGDGPIPIDTRRLKLSPDALFHVSLVGAWPQVFEGYAGTLGPDGRAKSLMHIPRLTGLVGVYLHTAFVTLDAFAPSGIKSISNTESFMVTR